MKIYFKTLLTFSLTLSALCSFAVLAKDYKVEVLLFKNLTDQQTFESLHYSPPAEMRSASNYWLIKPSMLLEEAALIKKSNKYELLEHYSWGQESLPYSKSTSFPLTQNSINGWLKVYANHLLYINIDLDISGYRLEEKRRIKLNERHFFDHPKYGLLVQVSRLEKDTADTNSDPALDEQSIRSSR